MMNLYKITQIIARNYFVVIILIIAALGRMWKLNELLYFTLDEELEAFIVKNIVTGFHYPAIGISVAPVGIYLSPIFYFLVSLPLWIGKLNPLFWGYTASLIGILTTGIFYFTTKKMFSQRVATFASTLYASSFLMVLYDKHFWNVTFMPLVSILTIFSLDRIIGGNYKWSLVLAIALSIGLSSHLSVMPLIFLVIFIWIVKKLVILRKETLISIGIIFASQLPLLIFELRHQFYQSKILFKFFAGNHSGVNFSRIMENISLLPTVFSRLIYTFGTHDLAREHSYGIVEIAQRDSRVSSGAFALCVVLLLFFGYLIIKKWKNKAYFLHGSLIILTILGLIFYGILFTGSIFEFYLAILFPTLFIISAIFLDLLIAKFKFPTLFLIIFLITINIWATLTSFNSYGIFEKMNIVNWVKSQNDIGDYELHSIGRDHKYEGYRYLFEQFYKSPTRSYVDPQLSWLYQRPISSKSSPNIIVITSTEPDYQAEIEQERNLYLPFAVSEKQFGEINVMIIRNPLFKNIQK